MDREVWGPKVWFIIHRLSFFSDRTDIVGAWTRMLKDLHEIIPCALCKDHMGKYCLDNPLRRVVAADAKGVDVKKAIILWAYKFHNRVNWSKGVADFNFEHLPLYYAYGSRADLVQDVNRTMGEIEELWSKVPLRHWKESMRLLLGLIAGGPLG
jgi:hypothetical protein